jgi:predicted enzyme related to lactoylglutathione lyase
LKLPATDVGDGWLIFDPPEADLGVHPTDGTNQPPSGTATLSFYCDDIATTMRELQSRGVEFTQEPQDQGYGLITYFKVPGDYVIQLYEPKYAT